MDLFDVFLIAALSIIVAAICILVIYNRRRSIRDHPNLDLELTPLGAVLVALWLAAIIYAVANAYPERYFGEEWLSGYIFITAAFVALFAVGVVFSVVGRPLIKKRDV